MHAKLPFCLLIGAAVFLQPPCIGTPTQPSSSTKNTPKSATAVQHSIARLDAASHNIVFNGPPPDDKTPDNAAVWTSKGRQFYRAKNFRLAADQFHQALIALQQERSGGPFLFAALHNYAQALKEEGKSSEAAKYFAQADAVAKQAELPPQTSEMLDVGLNTASREIRETVFNAGLMQQHNRVGAIPTYLRVDEEETLKAILQRAGQMRSFGNYEASAQLFKRAVALASKVQPPDRELVLALNGLAASYAKIHRTELATTTYHQALDAADKQEGQKSELYGSILNNIAAFEFDQGQYAPAERDSKKAIELFESNQSSDSVEVGQAYYTLSVAQAAQEKLDTSLDACKKAVEYYSQTLTDDPRLALALDNLGTLYDQKDDAANGEKCHRRSIEIYSKLYGDGSADLAIAYNNLANSLMQEERDDDAIKALEQSVKVMSKVYGADSPQTKQLSAHLSSFVASTKSAK